MLESAAAHVTVALGTLAALSLCVLLEYEGLTLVWRRLSRHVGPRRIKVLYGIVSVLLIHMLQIALFGMMLWLLTRWPACGALAGEAAGGFLDYVYFSAVSFSTVGFGEIWPVGAIRLLAAVESLSGFVLITWSASFTYLEMEKFWRPEDLKEGSEQRGE